MEKKYSMKVEIKRKGIQQCLYQTKYAVKDCDKRQKRKMHNDERSIQGDMKL